MLSPGSVFQVTIRTLQVHHVAYHTETAGANQGRVLAPFLSIFFFLSFFFLNLFLSYVCKCVSSWCVRARTMNVPGRKKTLDSPELESQAVVSHHVGSAFWSSVRAVSTLIHCIPLSHPELRCTRLYLFKKLVVLLKGLK